MRFSQVFVFAIMAVLASTSARANVIFRGDFQTGDLSQWGSVESANPSHLQVVTSPTPAGDKYALGVTVVPGDVIFGGTRDEVDYTADSPKNGDERYYHWQTMFPSDFQSANTWQLFTQWHQYSNGGSPPVEFWVNGETINIDDQGTILWTTPLVRGVWHDFIVHVVWSSDATVGGVEIWYDGQHVLPLTHGATMFPNDTIYLKQGLYRNSSINYNQTIYHAGMVVGTTLADVGASMVAQPTTGGSSSTTTSGSTSSSGSGQTGGTTGGTPSSGSTGTSGSTSSSGSGNTSGTTTGAPAPSTGTTGTTTTSSGTTTTTTGLSTETGTASAGPRGGCNATGSASALALLVAAAGLLRRRRTA